MKKVSLLYWAVLSDFANITLNSGLSLESRVNKIKMASTYQSDLKTRSQMALNFAL